LVLLDKGRGATNKTRGDNSSFARIYEASKKEGEVFRLAGSSFL